MKKLKGFTEKITRKQIILSIVVAISLLLFLVVQILSLHLKNSLSTQQMAKRWDSSGKSAQVSCFISENAQITTQQLTNLEHAVDAALIEISISKEKESERLWVDAYSARGELTVESGKTSVTSTAIGVGGDFFLFHPLKLVSGSYFSDEDLMKDYIILDEDGAWQLFGSSDVAGMQVVIKGVPHIVRGVVERGSGRMNDKAGNDKVTFYVSYDSLSKYGTSKGINAYEIVMPNPISGFAFTTIKEKIGIDELSFQVVENSKRYSMFSLLKVLSEYGIRSMNHKAIVYPYWENIARGYEDILATLLLLKFIFLLIPAIILFAYIIYRYRHRTWNMKTLLVLGMEWKEKLVLKYQNSDKIKIKGSFHTKRKKIKNFLKNKVDK